MTIQTNRPLAIGKERKKNVTICEWQCHCCGNAACDRQTDGRTKPRGRTTTSVSLKLYGTFHIVQRSRLPWMRLIVLTVGYVILSHGGDMCKSSSQKGTIYTGVLV